MSSSCWAVYYYVIYQIKRDKIIMSNSSSGLEYIASNAANDVDSVGGTIKLY